MGDKIEQILNELQNKNFNEQFKILARYFDLTTSDNHKIYRYWIGQIINKMILIIKNGVVMPDGNILRDPEMAEEFAVASLKQLDSAYEKCLTIIKANKNNKTTDSDSNSTSTLDKILIKLEKIDNDIETMKVKTMYDTELLNEGFIDFDFNAIQSAPKIALFLMENSLMEDIKPEILTRYKYNGKPFTLSTARQAVTDARLLLKKKKAKQAEKI